MQFLGRITYLLLYPLIAVVLSMRKRTRVIIVVNDKVVMTKSWLGNAKWVLPGGGLHRGEIVSEGATREVHEETGLILEPSRLQLIGDITQRYAASNIHYKVFVIHLNTEEQLHTISREIREVEWVRLSELTSHNTAPDSLKALAVWKKS